MQQIDSRPTPRRFPGMRRLLLAVFAAVVLALVFTAYLQPAFVLDLANRFILCL